MTIKYKCLYEITGRIEDVNTFLVPLQDLPKQEQGEPVAWYIREKDVVTTDREFALANPEMCEPLCAPQQRKRILFPTMLRKMWSGSEVQAWIDEYVNKDAA